MDPAPPARRIALGLLSALLVAACGTTAGERTATPTATSQAPGPSEEPTPTTAAPTTTEPDLPTSGEASCPSTSDIEEIVGAPVQRFAAFGGNFTGDLAYSSQGCSYETADGGAKVTVSRLSTDQPLDGRLFDALATAAAADADLYGFGPLDDLGDEAYLDGRQVVIRTGGAMVFIAHAPESDPRPGDPNLATELADELVDLDWTPGSQPDCDAIGDVIADALDTELSSIPSGGFLGLDSVEITTIGCAFGLRSGDEVDVYVADDDQWDAWVEAKRSSLFTSSYAEVEIGDRTAFDLGDRLIVDDGTDESVDAPIEIATDGEDLSGPSGEALRRTVAELLVDG